MKKPAEDHSIELTAKRCAIAGSGIARIHEKHLTPLTIHSGDLVVVTTKKERNSIIIKIFADSLIGEQDIRLREEDIKRLKMKKNEQVEVSPYKQLTASHSKKKNRRLFRK